MPLVGIEEINFQCVWILLNELTFNVFGPYLTTLSNNIVVVAAAVTVVVAATAVAAAAVVIVTQSKALSLHNQQPVSKDFYTLIKATTHSATY